MVLCCRRAVGVCCRGVWNCGLFLFFLSLLCVCCHSIVGLGLR
nr:MAG TPA: hypothetical protein [Caudoviricetes sp.]